MASMSVRALSELEGTFVLAAERYDPRRGSLRNSSSASVPLRKLVTAVRRTVSSTDGSEGPCIVLDTSDAREGVITRGKLPVSIRALGSTKKVIEPGNVIVSRLRPYLRQVAFVDPQVRHRAEGVLLLGSTEFFVLRSVDDQPISFLVPFLLSQPVQEVLAAAQEGGHHPRFNECTLLGLPVPNRFLQQRDELSRATERSIELFRESEKMFLEMANRAADCFRDTAVPPAASLNEEEADAVPDRPE